VSSGKKENSIKAMERTRGAGGGGGRGGVGEKRRAGGGGGGGVRKGTNGDEPRRLEMEKGSQKDTVRVVREEAGHDSVICVT